MKTMCSRFMKAYPIAVGLIAFLLFPQAIKAQGNAQTFTQEQLIDLSPTNGWTQRANTR